MACILLRSSAVRIHDSQAYRKMDVTRERISRILYTIENYVSNREFMLELSPFVFRANVKPRFTVVWKFSFKYRSRAYLSNFEYPQDCLEPSPKPETSGWTKSITLHSGISITLDCCFLPPSCHIGIVCSWCVLDVLVVLNSWTRTIRFNFLVDVKNSVGYQT